VPHSHEDDYPEQATRVRLTLKDGRISETEIESMRSTRDAFLVSLRDIRDRDAAAALTGAELCVRQEDLPPLEPGELYLYELIGSRVSDTGGRDLGVVDGVVDNQGQILLRLKAPWGEPMLPLVEDTLVNFDREKQLLTVKLIAGLWD